MNQLSITNKTITLGSTIYQIRNITTVGKYRVKPKYWFPTGFIILSGLLGVIGIYLAAVNRELSFLNWFNTVALGLAVLGGLERTTKTDNYGLSLETSAGSARLITTKDESLIDKIIQRLHEVMNNQDSPANYTFNIADGDIINQRGTFETGIRM